MYSLSRLRVPVIAAMVLAGCGSGGASSGGTVPVVSAPEAVSAAAAPPQTPAPTPTPTPAAHHDMGSMTMATPPGTSVAATSLAGLPAIASGAKVADLLVKSWGSGEIPKSMAPDVVVAFRFLCTPSHNAYDDPIIYPNQPGGSPHLHTFFGNTKADARSTYASLRTTGDSTCNNLLNRSAYWIPAMMNGRGKVVMPDYISIYYKRRPASDPECQRMGKACIALPRGLRYVFGYNMTNPAKSSTFYVDCDGKGAVSGHFRSIPEAAKGCPAGAKLGMVVGAPSCWNGTELDSPDHRSHMAYASYGSWGYQKCPDTHPYVVPTFTLGAWYTTDDTLDRSGNAAVDAATWHLASDRMAGMAPTVPGASFHADWFGAWDDSIMDIWMANCIDKLLSCSGGDLGQGQQLKTTHAAVPGPFPVLASIPARP